MSEIVQLIREYPFWAVIIFLSALWAVERMVETWAHSRRPIVKCTCDCGCCETEE